MDLVGKTAIVTGGASGIGLATARLLRSQGAVVWIFDVPSEHPEDVGASFAADGIAIDVSDRNALQAAFDRVENLDMVVANVLLSLGMHMLSPTAVSLPFKLLLFVLVDGFYLLARALVLGYVG